MQPEGKVHFEQLAVSALRYLLERASHERLLIVNGGAHMQFHYRGPMLIDFYANAAELNTLDKTSISTEEKMIRRPLLDSAT
jgi:hypothetical protein